MCGIFSIFSKDGINIRLLVDIMNDLNHRGRDSYGISYVRDNDKTIHSLKSLVQFEKDMDIENIKIGITHNRYSTRKNKLNFEKEIQPIKFKNARIEFDLVHNGNIEAVERYIENMDNDLSDTQNIMKFFNETTPETFEEILKQFMNTIHCSFSIIILVDDTLYAMRDRYGYKPLSLGKIKNDYCISSEDCIKGFIKCRDIHAGEIMKINSNGFETIYHKDDTSQLKCIFEFIYFMNENSTFNNHKVHAIRRNLGIKLATLEKYVYSKKDTVVIGSPNTSIPMGEGYAEALNLEYKQALRKKKECGRTFILKDQSLRKEYCKKFIIDEQSIRDKIIILVDDSIVRGNTIQSLSNMFHEHGCKELHIRICSPELRHPCIYGIDIPTREELIINKYTISQIEERYQLTSLRYITIEKMMEAFSGDKEFCCACFDGNYNKELEW